MQKQLTWAIKGEDLDSDRKSMLVENVKVYNNIDETKVVGDWIRTIKVLFEKNLFTGFKVACVKNR